MADKIEKLGDMIEPRSSHVQVERGRLEKLEAAEQERDELKARVAELEEAVQIKSEATDLWFNENQKHKAECARLREALTEARQFVYDRMGHEDLLATIDAAIKPKPQELPE